MQNQSRFSEVVRPLAAVVRLSSRPAVQDPLVHQGHVRGGGRGMMDAGVELAFDDADKGDGVAAGGSEESGLGSCGREKQDLGAAGVHAGRAAEVPTEEGG